MSRERAIAMKCQLLIGSVDGSPFTCPCIYAGQCQLSEDQRDFWKHNSKVREQRNKNTVFFLERQNDVTTERAIQNQS